MLHVTFPAPFACLGTPALAEPPAPEPVPLPEGAVLRRPTTLARAARIPGVTAAAVALLLIYLKKRGALQRDRQDLKDPDSQRKLA